MDDEVPVQSLGRQDAERLRELLLQGCAANGITIVRGSIAKDHVHMLLSCPPTLSPSKIMRLLKGRSSKLIQTEFEGLRKMYWDQQLWATGYFCRRVGAVTEEMVKAYIENQQGESKGIFKIAE